MFGTIQLVRNHSKTTHSYFTFGYYDNEKSLLKDLELLVDMGKVEKVEHFIRRNDNYHSYYVTIK